MTKDELHRRAISVRRLAGIHGRRVVALWHSGRVYAFPTGHPLIAQLEVDGATVLGEFGPTASVLQIYTTAKGIIPRGGING